MNTTPKKLLALFVALLSVSAFANAQAGDRDGYSRSHNAHRAHVSHRAHHGPARARHYRGHERGHKRGHKHGRKHAYKNHYRHVAHAPRYRPAYVAYPAPVYVGRPVYRSGASIWVDGIGFSFYTGH